MNQITQAISFARDNFFYLFALCIPVLVLEGVLATIITPLGNVTQVEDIKDFMELNAVLVGLLGLALILVSITFIGALVSGYESINLSANRTTIDLYSAGFRKFFILLGANILFVLAIMLGFIMLVLPAFYLMGRLSLFPSLIMFENEGVTKSLGRSWEMTDEYGGKLFGITLFFWGGTLITSLIIGALVPESTLQIFILLLIEYAIIIPWMYVYYSLYKSLSN